MDTLEKERQQNENKVLPNQKQKRKRKGKSTVPQTQQLPTLAKCDESSLESFTTTKHRHDHRKEVTPEEITHLMNNKKNNNSLERRRKIKLLKVSNTVKQINVVQVDEPPEVTTPEPPKEPETQEQNLSQLSEQRCLSLFDNMSIGEQGIPHIVRLRKTPKNKESQELGVPF